MKRFMLSTLVVALFVAPAFAEGGRKVVVASDGDYPPFAMTLPDGSLSGFSIEIARAICENRKLDCQFVKQEFAGLIPSLVAGKSDLLAALAISEERKKSVMFSDPTYDSPVYFIGKKDLKFNAGDPASYKDLKVGVETASIMECYVDSEMPQAQKALYKAQADALQDLKNGRVDVLIGEGLQFEEHFLKSNPEYALLGDSLSSPTCFGLGSGMAMRHQDTELAKIVNEGIAAIRADGTYKAINDKYFAIDVSPK